MKVTILKPIKLALLFSATISQISCAQNIIAPYFSGLSEGIASSESCSNYQGYSINLIENEGDQQFDIYKDAKCEGSKIDSIVLGVEANLAGIWQNFLVFDEGTDVNGHNLRLVSITKNEDVYTLPFEGEAPQFENTKISYFAPSENDATAEQCNSIGIDFQEMTDNSAGVLIGPKYEFLTATKKATQVKGQYTCYAFQ